jgi:hypothetical protein
MDDMELYNEKGMDAVIEARSERGKRLAKRFADIPKGLSFPEFLMQSDVADLDLDFITAHQMFEAYEKGE